MPHEGNRESTVSASNTFQPSEGEQIRSKKVKIRWAPALWRGKVEAEENKNPVSDKQQEKSSRGVPACEHEKGGWGSGTCSRGLGVGRRLGMNRRTGVWTAQPFQKSNRDGAGWSGIVGEEATWLIIITSWHQGGRVGPGGELNSLIRNGESESDNQVQGPGDSAIAATTKTEEEI